MDFTILQWNLNGFYTRKERLEILIKDTKPDIICLQETNFTKDHAGHIKNYHSHHKNRLTAGKASGGVAIYVHNNVTHHTIPLITDMEAAAVRVTLTSDVTICNVYLPNSYNLNPNNLKKLTDQLPRPYFLLGDFNSHSTLWGSNKNDPRGAAIESLIDLQNLCILNSNQPTHVNIANGTLSAIDLCLCTSNLTHAWELEVLDDPHDSDHFPLIISRPNLNPPNTTQHNPNHTLPPRWKLKQANWTEFKKIISSQITELSTIITTPSDPHEADLIVEQFTNLLLEAASKTIPKTSTISNKSAKQTPWWNTDCETNIKNAKHAFNVFKKHPTLDNKITYKRLRCLARRTVKNSKKESWRNFVGSINNQAPIKAIWNKINQIRGSKKSTYIQSLTTSQNKITSNPTEIANTLAETYAKNSNDSNSDDAFLNYKNNTESMPENQIFTDTDQPFNTPFNIHELRTALHRCKNSSPGPDNIPNIFLKNLPEIALQHLLTIYNHIWNNMIFPKKWREAIVIPIHKPGKDISKPTSYRPISLTNTLCKLLEKMVNRRLIWHLESTTFFAKEQSGFRHHRSTTDHLVNFHTAICEAFVNDFHLAAISMDIEKAFEMVWKDRIIKTLYNNKITGKMLALVYNFLKDRVIRVKANGTLSEIFELHNGVPQGSVLSVTLFLISINDAPTILSPPVECLIFADDITIFCAGKHIAATEELLQDSLNNLQSWSNQSGLKFSPSKTVSICFNRSHMTPKLNLTLNQKAIENVESMKLLGLTFDNKLSWKKHIETLKDNCTKRLSIIKSLSSSSWGADHTTLLNTYKAIIKPKLDYGAVIYNSAKPAFLKKLDPIHHKALRMSIGAFHTSPINSILLETGELRLKEHRKLLTLKYASKIAATPFNPAYTNTFSNKYENKYIIRNRLPQPLYHKLNVILKETNFMLPTTYKKTIQHTPPWTNPKIEILSELSPYSKTQHNHSTLKSLVNEVHQKYKNFCHIYTDGSKTPVGTAYAVITPDTTIANKINNSASVLTSELTAIYKALEYIDTKQETEFIIFSDSQSAIQAISDFSSNDELIQIIQDLYMHQQNTDKIVYLSWIPAHIGVSGNEKADLEAKTVANNPLPIPIPNPIETKITYKDLKKYITTNFIKAKRKSLLEICPSKYLLPTDYNGQLQFPSNSTRKEQTALTRIRIGHSKLTHTYILDKNPPPMCDKCNIPTNIHHILLECPKYDSTRKRLKMPKERTHLLNTTQAQTNVLQFLKITDLLEKL